MGWLKDPRFDLTLIVGITLLACMMGGAVALAPSLFLPLLAFHTWCFGFDHVIATWTKLAGVPEDRRRNRLLIYVLPPVVFSATLLIGQSAGIGVLNTGYFFFQWVHTTRQSWGIAQHYRRAAGGIPSHPRWLSELTLWSLPVVGLLHRCHQQPGKFLWMDLFLPAIPGVVVTIAGAVAAILVAVFFWTRRRELLLPHTLYMCTHFLVFAVGYLVIDDLHAGWLLVNVWHNVQYLAYVWMHNRARFDGRVRPDARILSWLCQPGVKRGIGYFAACLAISTPLFAAIYALGDRIDLWLGGRLISISLVFALALNFHHYIVDGLIWKRSRAMIIAIVCLASATARADAKCGPGSDIAALGRILSLRGDGANATELFDKACRKKDGPGCYQLATQYNIGQGGVAKDEARANQLFAQTARLVEAGCRAGCQRDCVTLGWISHTAQGVVHDGPRSVALLTAACEQGAAEGCFLLGTMNFFAYELPKDAARALSLHRRACDLGDPLGCNSVAYQLESGYGVAADAARAKTYYARACELGHTVSCDRAKSR